MSHPAGLAAALSLAATSAIALEPLAPPGNHAAVCQYLGVVVERAETLWMAGEGASAALGPYVEALYSMAFSAETRQTVDADDLDALLSAGETTLALLGAAPIDENAERMQAALDSFAKRHRCRIVWEN